MTLPAREQRTLDGIAESLRISEPRLSAMFGIFTRLTASDQPPCREQLAETGALTRLAARWHGRPGTGNELGRRAWRRALVLGQVAIAFVLLAVLIGVSPGHAGSCSPRLPRAALGMAARSQGCAAQAGRPQESGLRR